MDYQSKFTGPEIDLYLEAAKKLSEIETYDGFKTEDDWQVGSVDISKSGNFVEVNIRGIKYISDQSLINPSYKGPFILGILPEGFRPRFAVSSALNDSVRIYNGAVTIYADGRIGIFRNGNIAMPTNASLHFTFITDGNS